ncbi:MAG TPA: CARDB domain-containing protein [Anaerohalosphaeraceae bacterium]|nr:CARDB domain-containing protein [Anaerohalosphaeraceae bacterium]
MSKKSTFFTFIILFGFDLTFAADGDLLWNFDGVSIPITGTNLNLFDLATDQDGGIFFAWEVDASYQVRLQRVDYTGQTGGHFPGPAWSSEVVLSSGLENQNPDVISDGNGGAFVAWVEKISETPPVNTWVYKAQRVNSSGTKLWASAVTLTSSYMASGTSQPKPILVGDGGSGAYVVMQYNSACHVVHFNENGVLTGGVDGLSMDFTMKDAVSDGAGGVIATGLSSVQVTANRAAVSGSSVAALWGSGVTVGNTTHTTTAVHAVSDGHGGAIVCWNTSDNVRIQRINYAGSVLWQAGGLELVSAAAVGGSAWTYGISSDVCSNGAEGAYAVWTDWRNEPAYGGNCDIYAQHIDCDGTIRWALYGVRINNLPAGSQRNPVICADSTGGAIAAWQDYYYLSYNIRACRVNAEGSLVWSNWVINDDGYPDNPGAEQSYPKILFANDGPSPVGAIIAWKDKRSARDNYCQKMEINTLQAPLAPSNLTAAVTSPQIHLQWKDNSANENGFEIEYKQWSRFWTEPVSWTVLDSVGANVMSYQVNETTYYNNYYKFRLRAFNSEGFSDYSNTATVLVGLFLYSITVTQPNGGQSWPAGAVREITWTSTGGIPSVQIDYSLDGGSHWMDPPIAASTANDGSFLWTVPNTPSDNCIIRIQDASDGDPHDLSNQPFRITPAAPDLVIESFVCEQQQMAIQDQVLTFHCTVRNIGSQGTGGSFYMDFYPNRSVPPGKEWGELFCLIPSLEPDETDTWNFSYTYPIPGPRSIYVQADTDQTISEADETNNITGPHLLTVYEFERKEETNDIYLWFGGDDHPDTPRNIGCGQSILLPRSAWVGYVGLQFAKRFDYVSNPSGTGHAVTLVLDVRSGDGTILKTVTKDLPASFSGGWVLFPVEMDLWGRQTYIFTSYLQDGHLNNLSSSITARTDNPWPDSQGYYLNNSSSPFDMKTWNLWNMFSWDFNFRIAGFYTDLSPSDFLRDYQVNLADFAQLAQQWLRADCILPGWCSGTDLDYSGGIDLDDLDQWTEDWLWEGYGALEKADIAAMDAQMSSAPIYGSNGSQFWPGTYFVYVTNSGRYGKFIAEKYEPTENHRLTIGWITYNADGTIYSTGTGLNIRGTFSCDLDLGTEGGTGLDWNWAMHTSTERALDPRNGARFKLMYRSPAP